MASNVYTKNEILQILAQKGYFIDAYTLNTFFAQWNVEAIFEDEQGSEFFDKNTLDLVLSKLFSSNIQEQKVQEAIDIQIEPEPQTLAPEQPAASPFGQQPAVDNQIPNLNLQNQEIGNINLSIDDSETKNILSNIALSDGTPLINKIQSDVNINIPVQNQPVIPQTNFQEEAENDFKKPQKKKTIGILEGAIQQQMGISEPFEPNANITEESINGFQQQTEQITPSESVLNITPEPVVPEIQDSSDNADFDDISLISDSLEAQEKFREYVVSEFQKKDQQPAQQSNEFKLDISERTISMIARTMAKKIAKHVSSICSADARSAAQLDEIKEENKKLIERTKTLEEQNKKLRLLLAESNKNLNSYKPSIFGLYKKVPPS